MHARWATHGSAKQPENNHPFIGGGFYLVHNGVIANYEELAVKYRLKMRSECDSEIVLLLAKAFPHPATGLDIALRECKGSMAVALYDERRDTVFLARVGKPLVIGRLVNDKRIFFASTEEILQSAFDTVLGPKRPAWQLLMPIASGRIIALTPDGRLVLHEPPRTLDLDRLLGDSFFAE